MEPNTVAHLKNCFLRGAQGTKVEAYTDVRRDFSYRSATMKATILVCATFPSREECVSDPLQAGVFGRVHRFFDQ
jgi:hypothetical protein